MTLGPAIPGLAIDPRRCRNHLDQNEARIGSLAHQGGLAARSHPDRSAHPGSKQLREPPGSANILQISPKCSRAIIGYDRQMDHISDVSPVEIAAVAAVLSEPARTAILIFLLDGRARTAGELAFVAGVSAPTASSHLAKLAESGLIVAIPQGRHRYHRLARPEAAQAIEALTVLAAAQPRKARIPGPRDRALREGRSCYDHFAGHLGVALADALLATACVVEDGQDFRITEEGERRFARIGVDVPTLRGGRRPLCRCCIDWSERRPHLAGAVGAHLAESCMSSGWVERIGQTRGICVTKIGHQAFLEHFGLDLSISGTARPHTSDCRR